jgi:hypothetical protein
VNIELDGIPLVKTDQSQTGGQIEVRNVFNISTTDKRDMIEHKIPGMEGDVFQNLGRSPVEISFDGTFQGKTAKENLEILRTKFKQGTPLPFHSDLSGAADITKVLINDLRVEEVAGVTGSYHYFIVIQEYKEPPPEPVIPPSQDDAAAQWQEEKSQEAVDSINVLVGKVLDADRKPKTGVTVFASDSNGGVYKAETDKDGMYRIDKLPPGKYTFSVDSDEYEGSEKVIFVGQGEEEKSSEDTEEAEEEESKEERPSEEAEEEEPVDEQPSEEAEEEESGGEPPSED